VSDHHCYACSFREGNYGGSWTQNNRRKQGRAVVYEAMVEWIESLGDAEFSMTTWRAMRDTLGWSDSNMMSHAIKDMLLHGLLICVRRDSKGHCRSYRTSPQVVLALTA
jgi:hypothetical protein